MCFHAGFAILRRFGGRAGIGILDGDRQGAGFHQGIAECLGLLGVRNDAGINPGHLLTPDFFFLGQHFFQVVNAGAAVDESLVAHQLMVQRNIGLDAFDQHFR